MYSPENFSKTVRTLAAMAEYINHIEDSFNLDNIMALELLNEPWAHLVSRSPRESSSLIQSKRGRLLRFRFSNWPTFVPKSPFESRRS